nr:unnamed protein product [Naegleria fowleri]
MSNNSPLQELPHEILTHIFSFLLPGQDQYHHSMDIYKIMVRDILPSSHTCMAFRKVIRNNQELWKYCFFDLLYGWMASDDFFDTRVVSSLMRERDAHKTDKIRERKCYIYEIGYHTMMKFIRHVAGEPSHVIQKMTLQNPPSHLHQVDDNATIDDLFQESSTVIEWMDLVFADLANVRQLVFMSSTVAEDEVINCKATSTPKRLSKLENLSLYMDDCTKMLPILVCHEQSKLKSFL